MLIETVSPTPTEVPWAPLLSTVTAVASGGYRTYPWFTVVSVRLNVSNIPSWFVPSGAY